MASLPSYAEILLPKYSEERMPALLRSEMESGPPKQAKIRSTVMVKRSVTFLIRSLADYRSFQTWFSVTINEGADWFTWTDPVSGTTKNARFVGGGYKAIPQGSLARWHVQAQIETWG